jgi:hypothetical protein
MVDKRKHHKQHPTIKRLLHSPKWIWGELVWYCKWWITLFINFFHLLYWFGGVLLKGGVKLIELHDNLWDEIEYKIENLREDNVLD